MVKLESSPDERGGRCADGTNVPILRLSTQQKSFHSSHLNTGEVWAVLELFQDGWVRVHDVGCIQGAAHVSQHCHGILSQTRTGYTLKESNQSQNLFLDEINTSVTVVRELTRQFLALVKRALRL